MPIIRVFDVAMPIIGVIGVAIPIIGVNGLTIPIFGVNGLTMLNIFELLVLVWKCQLLKLSVLK